MQTLLLAVEAEASKLNMTFNSKKTVYVVFNPTDRRKVVCASFPDFTLAGCKLKCFDSFRYLGHMIDNCLCDDQDINREIIALLPEPTYCQGVLSVVLFKLKFDYSTHFVSVFMMLRCGILLVMVLF
jgi:hypothetical protein